MVDESQRAKRTLPLTRMWDQDIQVSSEAGLGQSAKVKAVAADDRVIANIETALHEMKLRVEYLKQNNLVGGEHGKKYLPKVQLWPHEAGTSNLKIYCPAVPDSVLESIETPTEE